MKITVLGAGAWGTALARILAKRDHDVVIWDFFPEAVESINRKHVNERYLPGIELPLNLRGEADAAKAIAGAEMVVVAAVSKAYRNVSKPLRDFTGIVVSVTKGIEFETGATMTDILRENSPKSRIVAMSGPTLATEVAKGIPTAIVAASADAEAAKTVQALFHGPAFRVYTSSDIHGVELGGALKNVIAIGAGVCDGLGFGDNSKAALLTRAISEMRRLGVACGAQADTFTGLSGLGDLMVTCFSPLSRNRGFGERIGKGEKAEAIVASMTAVAEGYPNAKSARELARKHGVTTPIIDEVYAMLYEGKDVRKAVLDLTGRESKAED